MPPSVLILYNTADSENETGGDFLCKESNAAVLDQVNAVGFALENLGIDYRTEGVSRLEQLPTVLAGSKNEIIFNLVEELPGSITDACYVPAVCRAHGRAITGNDTAALLLAQNKWHAKAVFKTCGFACPDGVAVPVGQKLDHAGLKNGRYIVKPLLCDGSEGIDDSSVVDVPGKAAQKAVRKIHEQFNQPAIIEQFIDGRELNVSLVQSNGQFQVLATAEIDFSTFGPERLRIVDYSAKWLTDSFGYNNTPPIIPADLPAAAEKLIRRYSLELCHLVGCRDYVRVDFRMDEKGRPFILEVNPNPDISPDAGFAAALDAADISYEDFIETLLDNALQRKGLTIFTGS